MFKNSPNRRIAALAALGLAACAIVLLYRVCKGLVQLPWPH